MRLFFICSAVFLLPIGASAAIGDPCPNGDECVPGEVCVGMQEKYCTARCPAGGCPDGFYCDNIGGGLRVCVQGEPSMGGTVEFGGDCSEQACVETLICVADDDRRFCSRACNGPGSCPDGYRCAGGETPACAPRNGPPGFGEACANGTDCAEPLECIERPSRQRPFCTTACEGGLPCGQGFECDGTHCVPPAQELPGFGETCALEAADPALVGCAEGFRCIGEGLNTWCTQVCTTENRCPEGYGCKLQPDSTGECRPGVEDDFVFSVQPQRDVPPPPPPPLDFGLEDEGGKKKDNGGCVTSPEDGSALIFGIGLLGLLGIIRRRA